MTPMAKRFFWDFCIKMFHGFRLGFPAVEVNSNTIVFKDPKASRRGLDCLNAAVESF
jgi:hypothetical protein